MNPFPKEPDSGDLIGRTLAAFGVERQFVLCGGHISPILVGARRSGLQVVDVRHEATAVFAAEATGRLTGVPGVAAVTVGPGVTNSITALKNAQMAQSPLVPLAGAAPSVLRGRGALQDMDQVAVVKSTVKMAATVIRTCDIVPVLTRAFEAAASGVPGPVFVEFPVDLLYPEALVRGWYGEKRRYAPPARLRDRLVRWHIDRSVDRLFACRLEEMHPGSFEVAVPPAPPGSGPRGGPGPGAHRPRRSRRSRTPTTQRLDPDTCRAAGRARGRNPHPGGGSRGRRQPAPPH